MAFNPGAASLCALGTHPRLHITPSNLAAFRTRWAAGDHFTLWKNLITALEGAAWSYTITQWFSAGGFLANTYMPADLYALVYLVGALPGDGRTKTIQEYGQKAVENLLAYCSSNGNAVTLTASGMTVNAYRVAHGFTTGTRVAISGSPDDAFNGFFSVTRIDADNFTYTATRGTPPASGSGYAYRYWSDPQTVRGVVFNQVCYAFDWLCGHAVAGGDGTPVLSSGQRAIVVKWLMDAAENMRALGAPNQSFWVGDTIQRLHSSAYFESHPLFLAALSCWNEQSIHGVADRDAACQTIMDHWETINLSGAGLDAQNWGNRGPDAVQYPAEEYGIGGATAEISAYIYDRCIHWDLAYNAMRTSCAGLDYLSGATNYPATWIKGAPIYLAQMASPNNIGTQGPYYLRTGQGDANSSLGSKPVARAAMIVLSGLNSILGNTDEAGLAKWLMDEWGQAMVPSTYGYFVIPAMFVDPDQVEVDPSTIPLPHLAFYPQQGVFIRSDYGAEPTTTAVWLGAPEYWLDGHSWDVGVGDNRVGNEPHGLMIYKHGPLLLCRGGGLRGPGTHNTKHRNHLVFDDPAVAGDGLRAANTEYTNISQYIPACEKYVGGIHNIFSDITKKADLVEAVTTGMYLPALVSSAKAKWMVFRGADSTKDDFVLEYSTVTMQAGKEAVPKRWQGNCPYAPTVDGGGWVADSAYQWHSDDGTLITVDNRNWGTGDPITPALTVASIKGRLFVKPLLPTTKRLYLRGGTDYEFMDESLSAYNPPEGTSGDQTMRTAAGQLFCGSHYFLIEATEEAATERFLIAFQASDSSGPPTAKTTSLITAVNIRGAHIQDAVNGDKVGIFSYDGTAQASYTYTITVGAAGGVHLISGLDPTKTYDVKRNGVTIVTGSAAARGAICFESAAGAATFVIEEAAGAPARRVFMLRRSA